MISAFLGALGADGQLARWSLRDITADSFLERGEVSADAGATWRVITEFTARRKG